MGDDADQVLLNYVNLLGVCVFGLIIVYHFLTSSKDDAHKE